MGEWTNEPSDVPTPPIAKEPEPSLRIPLGYLSNKVSQWDEFCSEVGLDPWCIKEGADPESEVRVSESVLRKYGVIR